MNRIILVFILVVLLIPLYFLFIGSFQDIHGLFVMPPKLWPTNATTANYEWVLQQPIGQWFSNTVLISTTTVVLALIVCATGGYAFAFYSFPFKKALWISALAGIMVPRMSMVIPLFIIIRKMGVSGTRLAAILPAIYMPIGLYLTRAYYETVPYSLLESARIDGANEMQILSRIIAPISKPILTAVALFTSIHSLGDYLWQLLQLQRPQVQTLLIGLMRAVMRRGGDVTNVNPIGRALAVAVVLLIPLLVIFLFANRYFTSSLTGALKE